MIRKLLVANRGEIACRILRTARRMGIGGVAVFSDADATALHVREADEAVRIGPAPAAGSYLSIEAIVRAAAACGADAVHPGYGFLSENAGLARACGDAGLVFVGPGAAAIAAMGSKSAAKVRVRALGVPVLPGYDGPRQEIEYLEQRALEAGFPLMIKPAAGGGGKGMRVVRSSEELRAALVSARRLAESSFADGSLLLERYLEEPRHVEVQVFADSHGHCVHLGDRDCSLQRRHQKVIEEAPAPDIPPAVRAALHAAAVEVARSIGYTNAGTVEFLFDGRDFYFLEMNTRLQVEHTVTEAVTGLDLVEWQLRVAAGEPLPLAQDEIRIDGHAVEARVCAEDPWREFMPSAGVLALADWPRGEAVRVDAGFATADVVPSSYDSLLAKVIAWAPDRERAIARLAQALERTCLAGIHTNERWLARLLRSAPFLERRQSVTLLDRSARQLAPEREPDTELWVMAALGVWGSAAHPGGNPWALADGFRPSLPACIELDLALGTHSRRIALELSGARPGAARVHGGCAAVDCSGTRVELAGVRLDGQHVEARIGSVLRRARLLRRESHLDLWMGDEHRELEIEDPRTREFAASAAGGGLVTPLPGVVSEIAVVVGQRVAAGELLMVIEAMKMEHSISAPHDGVVRAIHFVRGDRVPEGSELLELSQHTDSPPRLS